MDVIAQPVKILHIRITRSSDSAGFETYEYPVWYNKWCSSSYENLQKYDAKASQWYDNNSWWLGLEIRFYDLEKYTEFCLKWM